MYRKRKLTFNKISATLIVVKLFITSPGLILGSDEDVGLLGD